MKNKSLMRKVFLCAGLALGAALCAGDAEAQKVGGKDKEIASKKGVAESLGNKDFDEAKLPGTLEVGLALGSIVAMVAAIKWL